MIELLQENAKARAELSALFNAFLTKSFTKPPKQRLLINFSGGRTSAYMVYQILKHRSSHFDIRVVFANTGQEHENTLRFVKACDDHFGFNTTWVEAVTHNGRKGCTHKIVTFETASRNGEPYEAEIKKYGIPNMSFPHCTRELKINPIHSYIRSIGWKAKSYSTAIGIRVDEMRRVRKSAVKEKIVYPLVDWFPTTKPEINSWWEKQDFNLELLEYQGNCVWCWKKSFSKLMRVAKETPEVFDFPMRMEKENGLAGAIKDGVPRVFFRERTSTARLLELTQQLVGETHQFHNMDEDQDTGCSESCELYPMEVMETANA